MHYFIYPTKDSFITETTSSKNYGYDEILHLEKESNSYSTGSDGVSRILLQFDYSNISSSIVAGDISNPTYKLKLYEVEGQKSSDKEYSLSAFPLSQSWEEGTGK